VLTGAQTKYFSGQQPTWNGTYQQLVKFQHHKEQSEQELEYEPTQMIGDPPV